MDVIAGHFARDDIDLMFQRDLSHNIPSPDCNLPRERAFSVLGNPDQIDLQISLGMGAEFVKSHGYNL